MPHPGLILRAEGSEPADEWVRLANEEFNLSTSDPDPARSKAYLVRAEEKYRQALRLDPNHVIALNNIAVIYHAGYDPNEATLAIDRCVLLSQGEADNKKLAVIWANKAIINLDAKRHDASIEASTYAVGYNDSLEKPELGVYLCAALSNAGFGRPYEAVRLYDIILKEKPDHFPSAQNVCFAKTLTFCGPESVVVSQHSYADAHRKAGYDVPHHPLSLRRPIRVGYVSGDFKRHSAPMIWGAVALNHSKDFEPYYYSTLKVDPVDPYTKRFQEYIGGRWRDLVGKSDEECDAAIRKDHIDILVDLSAHTGGGRLPLFMRKPAPIQVHAWGFAHGSGCKEIDYFFADPVSIPEKERQYYVEKVIDLPCIVTYLPPVEYGLKGTSKPPVDRNGYFTFGVYCRYEKLSDEFLDCVRQILTAVPNSKVEFKDDSFRRPSCCHRVLQSITERSCDPSTDRVLFIGGTSHPDHMLCYQQADLILDPFPHSGGLAAMEQLYMGVPMVTLYGTQAAGRTASSVLTAMDRQQWVCLDQSEYVHKATVLGTTGYLYDLHDGLKESRKTLRQELLDSPVCKGYVEAVEECYRQMVGNYIARHQQ